MARTKRVQWGDQDVDAVEVAFSVRREEWNEYALDDGGLVRVRASVHRLYRVIGVDGKPAFAPNGDPAIVVEAQTQVVASE